jgi:hypothetical protein
MSVTSATTTTKFKRQVWTPLHFVSFDYDDTLLCSTYLTALGFTLSSNRQEIVARTGAWLDRLAISVIRLLEDAFKRTNQIYIVTNAETDWVQLSARLFIPAALPVLERCTIISARSTFEGTCGNKPLAWKFYTFCDCLARMQPLTRERNVLSFGDSHVEREAIRAATRGHALTRCKSIKFSECPTCEQLIKQQELVRSCFDYLFHHVEHLDLQLTVTEQPKKPLVSLPSPLVRSQPPSPSPLLPQLTPPTIPRILSAPVSPSTPDVKVPTELHVAVSSVNIDDVMSSPETPDSPVVVVAAAAAAASIVTPSPVSNGKRKKRTIIIVQRKARV